MGRTPEMVKKKLDSNNCIYYIMVTNKNIPVGSVRFDLEGTNIAVISYLISPDFQGNGHGQILLKLGIKELLNSNFSINFLKGIIMKENIASIRIFEKLEFELTNSSNNILTYTKSF